MKQRLILLIYATKLHGHPLFRSIPRHMIPRGRGIIILIWSFHYLQHLLKQQRILAFNLRVIHFLDRLSFGVVVLGQFGVVIGGDDGVGVG